MLALGSAGSLDKDLKVGTLICPEDFYAPEVAPSFYRDSRGHSVPGFDSEWRRIVISAWGSLTETELEDGGVYAQTVGPRFETPAEVSALAEYADMVGMTIAAETILAGEAALAYAAVCTIDNLANGIADKALTVDEYRRGRDRTARTVAATSSTCCRRSPRGFRAVEPRGHRRHARRGDRRAARRGRRDRRARARRWRRSRR